MRAASLTLLAVLLAAYSARAQAPTPTPEWRFRWQAGQTLTYKVDHVTTVNQVSEGGKTQTSVKLNLVKKWETVAVDAQGIATLRLTLLAMRNEQLRPGGETVLFDSNDLEKSAPGLREQLNKFIGQPLAEIKIDSTGKTLESKLSSLARYEAEPPFLLILPGTAVEAGGNWERKYQVTLEPPLGVGTKYDASQRYDCKSITGSLAALTLTTTFPTLPEAPLDRVPLLQRQPSGEIVFDVNNGRLHSARLTINQTIENHQGPGSSYHFQSSYSEQLVP